MNTIIKNFSKVLLVAISIFLMSIILSCSKDGETSSSGKDGVNGLNSINNSGFDVGMSANKPIATTTITPIKFDLIKTDDSNSYNVSAYEFKIPTSRFYHIHAQTGFFSTVAANTFGNLYIFKNGVAFKVKTQQISSNAVIDLSINATFLANDVLKFVYIKQVHLHYYLKKAVF